MEHDVIPLGERHAHHNWEYADTAAREAAGGFISADINKVALQLDTGAYWRLTGVAPATWASAGTVDKSSIGLGSVDNTPDADKPVSTAQALADTAVYEAATAASTPVAHATDTDNPHSVTKAQVGLGSVDNTSDADKPVSTAQATALGEKQDTLESGTNIKTVNGTSLLGSGDVAVAGLAGNTFTGAQVLSDQLVSRAMFKDTGFAYYDSTTTNALDYVNGSCQRWAPNTGAQTLTVSNWPPTGNLGELLIQGINLGAATITWPTINWVKSDGTTTTTFSSNGVTLQSSGTDWVYLWTRDAGTTIYGKVVR